MVAKIHSHSDSPPLEAVDRCDRCGAQAYYEALLPGPPSTAPRLLFCAHHARLHHPKMVEVAATIYDHRALLEGGDKEPAPTG